MREACNSLRSTPSWSSALKPSFQLHPSFPHDRSAASDGGGKAAKACSRKRRSKVYTGRLLAEKVPVLPLLSLLGFSVRH